MPLARDIKVIAGAVKLPLNVMAVPGLPDAAALKEMGVRRLSAATATFNAAYAALSEATAHFLAAGDSDALWKRRGEPLDYNALFGR